MVRFGQRWVLPFILSACSGGIALPTGSAATVPLPQATTAAASTGSVVYVDGSSFDDICALTKDRELRDGIYQVAWTMICATTPAYTSVAGQVDPHLVTVPIDAMRAGQAFRVIGNVVQAVANTLVITATSVTVQP